MWMPLGVVASAGVAASAEEWLRRARRNTRAARAILEDGFADMAAFHAQQAAEFALKALQIKLSGQFTRTHDLTDLANRVGAPPRVLKLFGSRARERPRPDSDVDLIVVGRRFRRKNPIDRAGPLHLAWDLGLPVDFLCYTPEEFEELSRRPSIVREALREGIRVPL